MKKIINLFLSFSFLIIPSCDKPNANTQNSDDVFTEEMQSLGISAEVYNALKQAGISLKDINLIKAEMTDNNIPQYDEAGNEINYLQVCGIKDDKTIIHLLRSSVDERPPYKYVKTYSFPNPEKKETIVDHGYGEKETLPFECVQFIKVLMPESDKSGNTVYGILADNFQSNEVLPVKDNYRLMIDRGGTIKTVAHEYVQTDPDLFDQYRISFTLHNLQLLEGYNGNIIAGLYCYSPSGERLFRISHWSRIYEWKVYRAELGHWLFPIDEKQMFIVYFDRYYPKSSSPSFACGGFVIDDLENSGVETNGNGSLPEQINPNSKEEYVYDYAKLLSVKDGIYTFDLPYTEYSGEKKSFKIVIDRDNHSYTIQ